MAEPKQRKKSNLRVAIVGGGLVGALNACYFAQRGWHVDLYEFRDDIRKLEHVPGRSINLALSHRGRSALAGVGLEEYVVENGIPMHARLVHDKTGQIVSRQPYGRPGQFIVSTSRRWLNEIMLTEAEKHPTVRIYFQHKLKYCNLRRKELVFEIINDGTEIIAGNFDLICGCDGAYSALRQSLMKTPAFNYSQEYITHGYLELCILPGHDNEFQMEPNVFHLWPRGNFVLIALANKDKSFTVTLFAPFKLFDTLINDEKILEFFQMNFPDALRMIGKHSLLDTFHKVKPGHLVSIKCTPHHFGDNIVLLGDAAHAMVPFYGQGMNCGFEDCLILHGLLDKHSNNIRAALEEYSTVRCPDAHAINDLAMYNYSELRDLVNQHGYKLRKHVDLILNTLFPRMWIPLYSMVTFSRIRYHEVVEKAKSTRPDFETIEWNYLYVDCDTDYYWYSCLFDENRTFGDTYSCIDLCEFFRFRRIEIMGIGYIYWYSICRLEVDYVFIHNVFCL